MESFTDEFFRGVLGERTAVADNLADIHGLAWEVVDPVLLDLCRLRVAMLLGCQSELGILNSDLSSEKMASLAEWPSSSLFNECEKSCLRFVEEFVVDVSSIPDGSAFAVRDHLGEEGFVNFVNALLVVEQRIRLQIVWGKLFQEVST
ncbi:MAG: hypothetical protein VYB80_02690 [Actinomycetota bacterium]|nr:hypothetical protein [Actinomycetota bacterium]